MDTQSFIILYKELLANEELMQKELAEMLGTSSQSLRILTRAFGNGVFWGLNASKHRFKLNGGNNMIYGYARVSTKKQLDGNGLEVQEKALLDAGADTVVKEQYTGTTMQRPKLDVLLAQLESGDTLMAAKLDRIARTAAEGATFIRSLQERGVAVHILNIGILDNSTTGRLMMNVLLAFAEFERDMIVERTQAGREIARTHAGYREGRRPLPQARKDAAVAMIRNGHSYKEACAATGLSRSTVLRAVQAARAKQDVY